MYVKACVLSLYVLDVYVKYWWRCCLSSTMGIYLVLIRSVCASHKVGNFYAKIFLCKGVRALPSCGSHLTSGPPSYLQGRRRMLPHHDCPGPSSARHRPVLLHHRTGRGWFSRTVSWRSSTCWVPVSQCLPQSMMRQWGSSGLKGGFTAANSWSQMPFTQLSWTSGIVTQLVIKDADMEVHHAASLQSCTANTEFCTAVKLSITTKVESHSSCA